MRRTSAHGFSMKQAEPHDRDAERAYTHGCHPSRRSPLSARVVEATGTGAYMTFPRRVPPRGTLEDYGLVLRKAADEAAVRVPPPACAHASPSRRVPLAGNNLRPCWHCWYSWYCRLQAGADPPGCVWHVVDHQVTGGMQGLGA
jgi:hypothetical protein